MMSEVIKYKRWDDEDIQLMVSNFQELTCDEIAVLLNRTVAAVKCMRKKLGLKKTKQSLKAIYSRPNAGQFKAGNLPYNTLADKVISIRVDNTGIPYKWIRISLGKWELLHRYLWLQTGKDIPRGFVIAYKDGDTMNCTLQNLEVISRVENLQRNRKKHYEKRESENLTHKQFLKLRSAEIKQRKKAGRKLRLDNEKRLKKNLQQKQVEPVIAKRVETRYDTKQVDYSKKILVRIDRKTAIYINQGEDAEQAKQKYFSTYNNKQAISRHATP